MKQILVNEELLRQVLNALRTCVPDRKYDDEYLEREYKELNDLRKSLRAALEQPAVEPYGWHVTGCNELLRGEYAQSDAELAAKRCGGTAKAIAVYTAPQAQQPQEPKCNPHPDAPHGFDRNASHTLGRYVCDCEGWEPEPQLLTDEELRQIRKAKQGHDEFARAVEQAVLRKNGVIVGKQ